MTRIETNRIDNIHVDLCDGLIHLYDKNGNVVFSLNLDVSDDSLYSSEGIDYIKVKRGD